MRVVGIYWAIGESDSSRVKRSGCDARSRAQHRPGRRARKHSARASDIAAPVAASAALIRERQSELERAIAPQARSATSGVRMGLGGNRKRRRRLLRYRANHLPAIAGHQATMASTSALIRTCRQQDRGRNRSDLPSCRGNSPCRAATKVVTTSSSARSAAGRSGQVKQGSTWLMRT
jgi:hypothetical protein